MDRINRSELTKLEIIRFTNQKILDEGYSNLHARAIAKELNMSPGNLTFHYRTKEDVLAELVELLCAFQWKMMEKEAKEGYSSVMAVCLEFAAMASMCDENEVAKDFYISAYSNPKCLGIIRKNDTARAKEVFKEYCSDWTDETFVEAETLVSGIEYATLLTTCDSVSLETRITGALNTILTIYNVPEDIRKVKIEKTLAKDYRKLGTRVLKEFREYVDHATEQALIDLLRGKNRTASVDSEEAI